MVVRQEFSSVLVQTKTGAHFEEEAGVCDEAVTESREQPRKPAGKDAPLERQVSLQCAPAQALSGCCL